MQTQNPKRATYSVRQVATLLGIGLNQAYEAVKRGEIPSIAIGGRKLIPKAAIDKMLSGQDAA